MTKKDVLCQWNTHITGVKSDSVCNSIYIVLQSTSRTCDHSKAVRVVKRLPQN